jgi:hypothetical protein
MELDRGHLDAAGIRADAPRLVHAAPARRETQDLGSDGRVGFRPLVLFLFRRVVGASDELDRRSTSRDVPAVTEQLATGMKAELAAGEPGALEPLVAELTGPRRAPTSSSSARPGGGSR